MRTPDQWTEEEELEISTARLEVQQAIRLITIATGRIAAVTQAPSAQGQGALTGLNMLDSRLDRWLKTAKYLRMHPEVMGDPDKVQEKITEGMRLCGGRPRRRWHE
jgi:hypothetical protein